MADAISRIEQQPFFGVKTSAGNSVRTSANLMSELLRGGLSDAGESVTSASAMRHAAVFQCVRVLAESIGSLPINLFQSTDAGQQPARKHPVNRIISETPNSFQTAPEFWETCLAHLGYRGNFYAWQARASTGQLGELIPLHPDSVTVKQLSDYTVEYKINYADGSSEIVTDPHKILHVKLFSLDGVHGVNPIEYARSTIGLSMALERHGSRLFRNGARPSGVLSTDARLDPAQAKENADTWHEAHGGENSGKVAVLGNGLKYQPIALNAVDSQWLENRKFQKADIAAFYRVPLHKINDLEHSTFSNIEHQSLEFVRDSLVPYARKIEHRIGFSLLTHAERAKGLFAKFNFNGLLRGDTAARAQFYKDLVFIGALSPNEVRNLEDINPREGGDVYLTPINMAHDGHPLTGAASAGNETGISNG